MVTTRTHHFFYNSLSTLFWNKCSTRSKQICYFLRISGVIINRMMFFSTTKTLQKRCIPRSFWSWSSWARGGPFFGERRKRRKGWGICTIFFLWKNLFWPSFLEPQKPKISTEKNIGREKCQIDFFLGGEYKVPFGMPRFLVQEIHIQVFLLNTIQASLFQALRDGFSTFSRERIRGAHLGNWNIILKNALGWDMDSFPGG